MNTTIYKNQPRCDACCKPACSCCPTVVGPTGQQGLPVPSAPQVRVLALPALPVLWVLRALPVRPAVTAKWGPQVPPVRRVATVKWGPQVQQVQPELLVLQAQQDLPVQ